MQVCPDTVQFALVQQVPFGMQLLLAGQRKLPAGHAQTPPAPEQTCPVAVQSAVVQQVAFPMQLFDAVHVRWPAGQLQLPPGPEHV